MEVSLVMFKADGTRRDFPVTKDRVVIGRKNACDLRIPLSSVSREHCEIRLADDDRAVICDLESSNGTFVNHERVQEKDLEPGDAIAIGPVVFTVVIDGEPAKIEPVRTIVSGQSGSSMPSAPGAGRERPPAAEDDRDQIDLSEAEASDRSGASTSAGTRPPAGTGSAAADDEVDLPIAEVLGDDDDAGELDLPEDFEFDIDLDEDDEDEGVGKPPATEATPPPDRSAKPAKSGKVRAKAQGSASRPEPVGESSDGEVDDEEDPIAALEALAELGDDLSDSDELAPPPEDDEEKRSA